MSSGNRNWIRLNDRARVRTKSGQIWRGRIISLEYDWLKDLVLYMCMVLDKPPPDSDTPLFHYKDSAAMEIVMPKQPEGVGEVRPLPIMQPGLALDNPVEKTANRQLVELLCTLVERPLIMEYLVKQEPDLLNQAMIMLYGGYEHERHNAN